MDIARLSVFKLAFGALAALLLVATTPQAACGQVVSEYGSFDISKFSDEEFALYEKQLNALLRTRRDEEKAFVRGVVIGVREKKIPAKLVQTTYGWVRNKRPNTKYPFVFFERVLRLQAAKLKIDPKFIPPFDYRIYRKMIVPRR